MSRKAAAAAAQSKRDDDNDETSHSSSCSASTGVANEPGAERDMIGKRCRVYFELGSDYFGRRDHSAASGWYLGVVAATGNPLRRGPTKGEARLLVRLDDATEEWHAIDEVQVLSAGGTARNRHLLFATVASSDEEPQLVKVANTCPNLLEVGDLVFGQFQCGGSWYRGRVAAVGTSDQGFSVCDICYDDGDYEFSVPYGNLYPKRNHVTLVERFLENTSWMIGLQVRIPSRTKKHLKVGVVIAASEDTPVVLEYTDPTDKSKTTERRAPRNVLSALFRDCKDRKDRSYYAWPYVAFAADNDRRATVGVTKQYLNETTTMALKVVQGRPSKADKENSNGAMSDDLEKSVATRKPLGAKRVMTTIPAHKQLSLDNSDLSDEEMPAASKKRKNVKSKAVQNEKVAAKAKGRRAQQAPFQNYSPYIRAVAAVGGFEYQKPVFYPIADHDSINAMPDSLSDALLKALNSPDPQLGEQFLALAAVLHNKLPASHHLKNLMDILLYGPKTHRGVFPDCHRLTMAQEYFQTLVERHGLASSIAASLAKDYWTLVFKQMTGVYYTVQGDETRPSRAALQRIGLTLHARACCMETFEVLLTQQLRGLLAQDKDFESTFHDIPIIGDVIIRGVKEAVEIAAEAYVHTWMHYGHLSVAEVTGIVDLTSDEGDFAESQANRLLCSMGKTLSYLACLYCHEAYETTDAVALLIGNVAQRDFSKFEFSASTLTETAPDALRNRIMLGFVLRLDNQVVPQIWSKLADQLDIARQFNLIFDT
jgi:hypothetical protein